MLNLRLFPLLIGCASLVLLLKMSGLIFGIPEYQTQAQEVQDDAQQSEAAQEDNGVEEAITPSVGEAPPGVSENEGAAENAGDSSVFIDGAVQTSEDLLLETLGKRRQRLEKRENDLNMREALLAATEKRLEKRVAELEALEKKINKDVDRVNAAKDAKIKDLIVMYESMKAKNAAAIFDRLDMVVLVDVARHMKPRKLADVMGKMNPDNARQLTIALAGLRDTKQPQVSEAIAQELPQIQGTEPATQ